MSDNNVKKTIQIGEDLINPYKRRGGGKGNKTIKVRKPIAKKNTFKLTSTKRELLNKIKEKREEERRKNRALNIVLSKGGGGDTEEDNKKKAILDEKNFESGFNDALKYLSKVREEHREKKMKKKRRRGLGEGLVMEVGGGGNDSVRSSSSVTSSIPSTAPVPNTLKSAAPKETKTVEKKVGAKNKEDKSRVIPASTSSTEIPTAPVTLTSSPDNLIVINTAPTDKEAVPASSQVAIPKVEVAVAPQLKPPNTPQVQVKPHLPIPQKPVPDVSSYPSSSNSKMHMNYNSYNSSSNVSNVIPLYGNLKGGKLPTYRAYHRTLRNRTISNKEGYGSSSNFTGGRKYITKSKQVKRKTIKKTYQLGRNKANNQLAVLIKNRDKNRKIMEEENILKRKPISEVKSYLYDKNMIRVGTNAPETVLRKMYETSILAGDITNRNPKVRLHNFTNSQSLN